MYKKSVRHSMTSLSSFSSNFFIAADSCPVHDTLATFRRRFLDELAGLFVPILEMAQEMKLFKLGTVCLDGTKIHTNASRRSALSRGHNAQAASPTRAGSTKAVGTGQTGRQCQHPMTKIFKMAEQRG
jgi:hypothetical protein